MIVCPINSRLYPTVSVIISRDRDALLSPVPERLLPLYVPCLVGRPPGSKFYQPVTVVVGRYGNISCLPPLYNSFPLDTEFTGLRSVNGQSCFSVSMIIGRDGNRFAIA